MRWPQYFGGRYTRAQKSAQRALAIQAETPELAQDNEFTVLGHLLAAGSAHRLQNRAARDEQLRRALELAGTQPGARARPRRARGCSPPNGRSTTATRRAPSQLLADLPLGVARRTHALRLKLQAARLGRQSQEALKTARLLVKHQGFSQVAALGPAALAGLRIARHRPRPRPAAPPLGQSRSGRPARRRSSPRAPPAVPSRSARPKTRAPGCARSGTAWPSSARRSARPWPRRWPTPSPASAPSGCAGSKRASLALPRDGAVALAGGCALAERGLWGKARALARAGRRTTRCCRPPARRKAWIALADLAAAKATAPRAAACFEAAARLG